MIEDLKIILVYISIDLKNFIITALKKASLFFIGLILIITAFFLGLKSELPFLYVISISIIFVLVLYIFKETLFRKSQFEFNNNFVKFLLDDKKSNDRQTLFSKDKLKEMSIEIKKDKNISALKRTILAFYITSLNTKGDMLKKENTSLNKELIRIHLKGYGLFLILLAFFELISLALAFGNNIQTDFIIFLSIIGFVFAYTLFTITIDPILYLLIQKKVFESNI